MSGNQTLSLTSSQLAEIEALGSQGKYVAMYEYIANQMSENLITGYTPEQLYWFQEALEVNGNDESNPACFFIRDMTRIGMGLTSNSDPAIQTASNEIAQNVFLQIKQDSAIPSFATQLNDDINVALNDAHLSIGEWGGSFYYWNAAYIDPATGSPTTIGQYIASNASERSTFIANTAQAMADTLFQFGGALESDPAAWKAFKQSFENLALGGPQSWAIGYDLMQQLSVDAGAALAEQFMQSLDLGWTSELFVADGSQNVTAGNGTEVLFAGQGLGGAANDTLVGGSGSDSFVFALPTSGSATETISDPTGNGQVAVLNGSGSVSMLGGSASQPLAAVAGETDTWTDSKGTIYTFDSTTDDLTITNGLLGSGNKIIVNGFDLGAATETVAQGGSANGFLGFYLADGISLTANATVGVDPPAPNFMSGSTQSYTIAVDAPSTSVQTVTVTLSGVPASDFGIATGAGVVPIGSGGTFTVTIAAGQTSAAFTLVNTGDVGQAATMTLNASMTNPGNSSGQAITSETLTQNYVEPSSDPFTNNSTSTVAGVAKTEASTGFNYTNYQAGTTAGASEQMVLTGADNYVTEGGENDFITEYKAGNNIILGSSASSNDILLNGAGTVAQAIALAGTDTTASGQRGDVVATGAGNDTIVGGNGNSLYLVGAGANVIYTGAGDDSVWGGFYSPNGVGSYADQFNWSASVDNSVPVTVTEGTHTVSYYQISTLNESVVGGAVDTVDAGIASGSDTVVAGNGNDYIALPDGSNYVLGGSGHDNIWGGTGNNTIFGGSGTDTIGAAGNGNDYVDAGTGSDLILFGGGNGNDTIMGGTGNDTILYTTSSGGASSGTGSDYVYGGSGDDLIVGGNGSDTLIAGSGNSSIYGGSGTESIVGGSGNDWLQGGTGNDTIEAGGGGNDTLLADGGSGSTTYIYGGSGSDAIQGGSGANVLYAGDGGTATAPTYVTADQTDATATTTIYGGLGVDQLKGGPGSAVIYTGDGGTAAAPTVVIAGTGKTTVYGGLGVDNIQGGSGTDVLYAGDGGDGSNVGGHPTTVIAGSGTDSLYGGAGADVLADTTGGADQIFAGSGDDTLIGSGSDTLTAGSGVDVFSASSGNETYVLDSGFSDDQIQQSGGTANLEFGSGIANTDLSITAGFTTDGQGLLEIGDEGTIDVAGGLTGAVGSVGFSSGSTYSLDQLISASGIGDGVDQTEQLQGTSDELTFSVDNNATLSTDPAATADTISAWGQNDTVSVAETAGEKSTVFVGGGAAIVTGGSGADTLTAGGYGDSITAGTGNQDLVAEGYYDVLAGGSGQDTLSATGTNDTLIAGSGIDTMVAAAGTDTLVGGSGGGDTFVVNNSADLVQASATAANDTIDASVSYALPVNVDTLVLEGSSNITGTGNTDASNLLEANSGNDTLTAGTGSDTLVGGLGNDVLVAGSGKDLLEGGAGSMTYAFNSGFGQAEIEPGAGAGAIQFGTGISASNLTLGLTTDSNGNPALLIQDGNSKVTVDGGLGGSIDQFAFAGGSQLTLAELFASGATVLAGSIAGASGDAFINTSAAASLSGSGNDTIVGTGASDTLTAGTGTESLLASGNDASVIGGSGTDTLVGAGNADTVVGGNGSQQLYAFGTGDVLVGGMGDDTLYGGAGSDTLTAGTGYTAMYGGAGADSIVLTAGGTVTFTPSSTSTTEVIELPVGMTLADFTAVQGTNGDLILESTSGNTTAIIKGYQGNNANGKLWMIADSTGGAELLSAWLGASATQPPANYAQEIADLQQAFEANLKATLNEIGQQGGTIQQPWLSFPQGPGNEYQFNGIGTQDVTVQGGTATLGGSDADQTTTTTTQTGTATYVVKTPVYQNVSVSGGQEFIPDSSLTQQQIEIMNSESGTAGPVGIQPTTNAGAQGFEVTQVPATDYVQTGTTTTYETVPVYTTFFKGTQNFTAYNVTGDGGNDVITAGGGAALNSGTAPDQSGRGYYFVGTMDAGFVGTVDTGDGNVSVNLGMNNGDESSSTQPFYYPGTPLPPGAFIEAGSGNDQVVGTGGADVIAAGTGFDDIDAGLGSTVYVPLEGVSTEDIYIQGPYYGGAPSPVGTLVLPSGVTPQDLQYRLITDVPNQYNTSESGATSTGDELQISDGDSSVLLPFGFNSSGNLYLSPNGSDNDGIDRFVFANGTVLSRSQIIAMAGTPVSISDFSPEVSPTNISLPAGSPIQGGNLFNASDSSGSTITWYQISNTGTDGGHFDLNGVVQAPGQAFMVSVDQLPELTYVPGANGTSDIVQVSAFDGVAWGNATPFYINVGATLYQATGPNQQVAGGSAGSDALLGGYAGDTLVGSSGQDAFEYNPGSGAEVISETAPTSTTSSNVLEFGGSITDSSLTLSAAAGGELVISTGGSEDSVSIEGFNPLNPLQAFPIQSFEFTDGTSLTLQQLLEDSNVAGTSGSFKNADGSVTSYDFTPSAQQVYSAQNVNASGEVTATFALNSDGSETTSDYTYNADGTHTDTVIATPAGGGASTTTTLGYDATNHLVSEQVKNPDGSTDAYTYNDAGQELTADITSANGATSDSTFTYNADGTHTDTVVATPTGGGASTTTTLGYDATNHLVSEQIKNPDGSSDAYTYNDAGQELTADLTNANASTSDSTFVYNADGTHTDTVVATPAGGGSSTTTTLGYDATNHLVNEQIKNPDGSTDAYTYNDAGQELTADITNANGSISDSTFTYNADGTHTDTVVATPAGGGTATTTTLGYDATNHLVSEQIKNPDGSTDAYTYNDAGQELTADITNANGSTSDSTFVYNSDGTHTDTVIATPAGGGASTTTTLGYDATNHLVSEQIKNPDGSTDAYTYNDAGQELTADITNTNGSTSDSTFVYNADGTHTDTVVATPAGGGASTTTTLGYDDTNHLVSEQIKNPDGSSDAYTYNDAGQELTADITSTNGATSDSTFTYNSDGTHTDTVVATPAGGGASTTTTLGYDATNHLVSEQIKNPDGASDAYTYNDAGQELTADITSANGATSDSTFTYNSDGTHTDTVVATSAGGGTATTTTLGYDATNHLVSEQIKNPDGSTDAYIYNDAGQELTADITNANGSTSDSTFVYNADGTHTDTVVATPAGGGTATTTTYDYSVQGSLSNENTYTPGLNGSYTDTWSQAGGSHGTYWWNASTSEYEEAWYDSNGSSWTDEYQYATGGSPGASGYSFDETYSASDGSKGTRDFNSATGTISLTWDSTATGSISGTTTDSGFIGLQNQNELTNIQPDLTFFNPKVSPGFQAFLAAH